MSNTIDSTYSPEVSAVMLVYNGEKHLREAMNSVLQQTFKDFEFIVINDGSTDKTLDIVKSYDDSRIKIINNPENIGIPRSRNIGLSRARGKFLAWCDSDDINFPRRFEEQVNFLRKHNEFGVCGTWQIYSKGKKDYVHKTERDSDIVKAMLLFMPSIMNPTAMMRMSLIKKNNLHYDTSLAIGEDHHFFLNCSRYFKLTNVQKVLVKYRSSETSIIKKYDSIKRERDRLHNTIHSNALKSLGIVASQKDLDLHLLTCSEEPFESFEEYKTCFMWLASLRKKNLQSGVYSVRAFDAVLAYRFYIISKKAAIFGIRVLPFFLKNSVKRFKKLDLPRTAMVAVLCILKKAK